MTDFVNHAAGTAIIAAVNALWSGILKTHPARTLALIYKVDVVWEGARIRTGPFNQSDSLNVIPMVYRLSYPRLSRIREVGINDVWHYAVWPGCSVYSIAQAFYLFS